MIGTRHVGQIGQRHRRRGEKKSIYEGRLRLMVGEVEDGTQLQRAGPTEKYAENRWKILVESKVSVTTPQVTTAPPGPFTRRAEAGHWSVTGEERR